MRALCVVVVLGLPAGAAAQWSVGVYAGGAWTHPAAVTVRLDAIETPVQIDPVNFRGEPLRPPIYYGYRAGRALGAGGLWLEAELIHLKVIADEQSLVRPVEAFAMTHGMNLLLANVVWRIPNCARLGWLARAGLGLTVPHAETRVAGRDVEGYQLGGAALQLAPGLAIRLTRRLSVTGEYKFTLARAVLDVAGGEVATSLRTHHVAWGLAAEL
jgi:hypothetical protein